MTDPSYFGPATLEAPRSTSARRSLQVRAYESLQDLQSLRPAWDDLLSAIPDASTFSTWEWLAPWWRAFGGGQQLMVLACFDESSRLVGLAPLALQRRSSGCPCQREARRGSNRGTLPLMVRGLSWS